MKHKERGNTHMAKEQLIFCGSSEIFLDKALTADSNADNGGNAFRIPSLVNADGTLIAAIDRASCGADCRSPGKGDQDQRRLLCLRFLH